MSVLSYLRAGIGLLVLHLLFFTGAGAQPLKVEGYAIMGSAYVTQFDGQYFTIQKKDGGAVIDLSGKVLSGGLKAASTGIVENYKIVINHGVYFSTVGGALVLKNLKGETLGTGRYSDARDFIVDNTVATMRTPQGASVIAYLDTMGREFARFDLTKYFAIAEPGAPKGGSSYMTLDDFLPFSGGLTPIRAKSSGKYGYMNKGLQLVIPVTFKAARPFSEGLAPVKNGDGYWGFIDTKGKLVIPYTYTYAPGRFASGLARVENQNGKWGYINKENKVLIAPQYEFASTFYKGYTLVRESYNTEPLLIDTTGAVIARFPKNTVYIDAATPSPGIGGGEEKFEYPFYISETLRGLVDEGEGVFERGMDYGLLSRDGKVMLDFRYKRLSDVHGGKLFADIRHNGNAAMPYEIGIMTDKGEWLVQFISPEF